MPKAQPSVLTFILNKLALFAPFTLLLWSSEHHPHLWRLRVRTACRVPLTTPLFNRQSGGFYKIFEKKYCSSSGDLSDRSNVFHSSPRPFYVPLFFHPTSNGSFCGSIGMEDIMANLLLIFR